MHQLYLWPPLCLLFPQALKSHFPSCSITMLSSQSTVGHILPPNKHRQDLGKHPATGPMGHHAATVTASGWQQAQRWLMLLAQKGRLMTSHQGRTHKLLALLFPWPKRSPSPKSAQSSRLVAARQVFLEASWAGNTFPILQNFPCSPVGWS